jgi:hypothetical protein
MKNSIGCIGYLAIISALVMTTGCGAEDTGSESDDTASTLQRLEFTTGGTDSTTAIWTYDSSTTKGIQDPGRPTFLTMHTCPTDSVMIGAHIGNNVWKCAKVPSGSLGTPIVDRTTVRNGMHACPPGKVLVGLHVGQNAWACAQASPAITTGHEITDGNPATTDGYMHVCPNHPFFSNHITAMTGLHIGNNIWTCGF